MTATETTKKRTAADPSEGSRELIDRAAEAGRTYAQAWESASLAGLRTAFDLQNEAIAAGQTIAGAVSEASRKMGDDWAEAVREGQTETVKLAQAGAKLVERTFDIR
ncbi:MAG: hypothetical protein ACRDF0_10710 [Candidatus Limnocylindria bacterium]